MSEHFQFCFLGNVFLSNVQPCVRLISFCLFVQKKCNIKNTKTIHHREETLIWKEEEEEENNLL
jgi:hypothetical protein